MGIKNLGPQLTIQEKSRGVRVRQLDGSDDYVAELVFGSTQVGNAAGDW